jgi:hypothetical protein
MNKTMYRITASFVIHCTVQALLYSWEEMDFYRYFAHFVTDLNKIRNKRSSHNTAMTVVVIRAG